MKIKLTPRGRAVIYILLGLTVLCLVLMILWSLVTFNVIENSFDSPEITPAPDKCVSDTVLEYDGTCREQER